MPVEEVSLDGHRRYPRHRYCSSLLDLVPCLVLPCGLAIDPVPAARRWNLRGSFNI